MMIEAVKLLREGRDRQRAGGQVLEHPAPRLDRPRAGRRSARGLRLRLLGRPGHDDSLSHEPRSQSLDDVVSLRRGRDGQRRRPRHRLHPLGPGRGDASHARSRPTAASSHSTTTRSSPIRSRSRSNIPATARSGSQRLLIYEQRLWSTNYPHNVDSGAEFYGDKGQMFFSRRGKVEVIVDSKEAAGGWHRTRRAERRAARAELVRRHPRHGQAQRRRVDGAPDDVAVPPGQHRHALGRSLAFDPQAEQVLGDKEANALLRREYREHWGTPRGA